MLASTGVAATVPSSLQTPPLTQLLRFCALTRDKRQDLQDVTAVILQCSVPCLHSASFFAMSGGTLLHEAAHDGRHAPQQTLWRSLNILMCTVPAQCKERGRTAA